MEGAKGCETGVNEKEWEVGSKVCAALYVASCGFLRLNDDCETELSGAV